MGRDTGAPARKRERCWNWEAVLRGAKGFRVRGSQKYYVPMLLIAYCDPPPVEMAMLHSAAWPAAFTGTSVFWGGVLLPASASRPYMAFRVPSRYLARVCKTSTVSASGKKWMPTGSTAAAAIHQHAANHQQHLPLPCSRRQQPPQQPCSPWGGQTRLKHAGKKGAVVLVGVCLRANDHDIRSNISQLLLYVSISPPRSGLSHVVVHSVPNRVKCRVGLPQQASARHLGAPRSLCMLRHENVMRRVCTRARTNLLVPQSCAAAAAAAVSHSLVGQSREVFVYLFLRACLLYRPLHL